MKKLTLLLFLVAPKAIGAGSTVDMQEQQLSVLEQIQTNTATTPTPSSSATGSNQKLGELTCSALTGSYATLVTPTFNACIFLIFNSCDATVVLSIDGGTTNFAKLESGEGLAVDFCANARHIASGVNVQAKHNGAAPTAGTLRASVAG